MPGATTIANFLAQYRDDPERPQPFGGRDGELGQLDGWLRAPEQPYLMLAAPPGRGKSALLARFCERLAGEDSGDSFQIVFVPISIRFEFNRQETVLRALATRLAAIHDEPAFGDSVDDWRDLVGELLLRAPPEGTRVLIVLDGLDEASGWQAGPSMWPNPPHPDVKVVVSARLTASHPQPEDWVRDLAWSGSGMMELGSLTVDGVRDVLAHMGPPLRALADDATAVGRLHSASAGDPLVVGLYVGHLWANPLPATEATLDWLSEAGPGLEGFIDRWWSDQERLWDDPAGAYNARRVFDLMACALGPLPRRDLLDLARRAEPLSGGDLDAALRALDRLVVSPSPRIYAVAHPRLVEHRLSRLQADGDLEGLERRFVTWAAESLEGSEPLSPYVVWHYGEHLERARAAPEQMTALLSQTWGAAWLTLTDDVTGWVDDIDRVHAAASRSDQAAAGQTSARWPALRAWCTYLRADAGATYELVDGAFAAALVRAGLWSERRALTRCARVEDLWSRAEHLVALAPALSGDGARLAAQLLRTLGDADDEPVREATAAVVSRLVEEGDSETAWGLVEDSESPSVRAAGLIATFPMLSEDEKIDVLNRIMREAAPIEELASGIDAELARRSFGDPPWRYLERQLRGNEHWWPADKDLEELAAPTLASALSLLAPWMTADERKKYVAQCLDAFATHRSPYDVDDAVSKLAPHLDEPAWHRARAIAQELLRDNPEWLLLADISLLPYAPRGARQPLLESLSRSVPSLLGNVTSSDIADALPTLVREGASVEVLDAIAELGGQDWIKASCLAAVAPHLDLAAVHRALDIAAGTRRVTQPEALAALFARQAECGEAEAALHAATSRYDSDEIGAALAVLRVASGEESFGDAVESLLAIDDRPLRCATATVAARLSPPSGEDLRLIVSSFGDPIGAEDALATETFALVSAELPAERLDDVETLATVAYVVQRGLHPRKDHIMISHFRQLAAAHGVERTLGRARSLCTETFDWPLATALAAVADRLEPGMEIDRAELMASASTRLAVVMAATLRLLPPRERPESLESAIGLQGAADVRSGAAGLLLGSVPDELYETAASTLLPDTLLGGQSAFALPETWARAMVDICPSIDAGRLELLLATSRQLSSGSARGELQAAIAARLAALGKFEEALACMDQLDREQTGVVIQQMAEVAPVAAIPPLLEHLHDRIGYDYWRGPRVLAGAALGRRIADLDAPELSRLLDLWHARHPTRGEVLVDLLIYAPAILTLGGPDTAADLAGRLQLP